ncbi:MAG: M20/M25/M40 family metallo-hydrolase, partial [Clostridia bacterium]|nr:M20/M25/M40 family metallo-hydrolase [Clostridia bacterium]
MRKIIENSFDQQVKDLQTLIRIPSVSRGEPREGMPYGEHVFQALRTAQDIARNLGFEKVWDVEARCGVVEYGQGDEIVAVMAHLDVVPEGTGWQYPPYGAEIHDGAMYGRG